jgi:plasmid stability protein
MSKMIQLRNVPDPLHKKLKSRAALEGLSLSDYLIGIVRKAAERPTDEEIRARLANLPPVELKTPAAVVVRQERDSR